MRNHRNAIQYLNSAQAQNYGNLAVLPALIGTSVFHFAIISSLIARLAPLPCLPFHFRADTAHIFIEAVKMFQVRYGVLDILSCWLHPDDERELNLSLLEGFFGPLLSALDAA